MVSLDNYMATTFSTSELASTCDRNSAFWCKRRYNKSVDSSDESVEESVEKSREKSIRNDISVAPPSTGTASFSSLSSCFFTIPAQRNRAFLYGFFKDSCRTMFSGLVKLNATKSH